LKRIILIDTTWDINSSVLQYALKVSKSPDTEIIGIFLAHDTDKETIEKAENTLKNLAQDFSSKGINFNSQVVPQKPEIFIRKIEELMPASLILIGDVKFSEEMKKAGVSVEALKERFVCPITTADALEIFEEKVHVKRSINWTRFILYAIGSVIMYGVFFPNIEILNKKIFMTETILGAIAIMVAVALHAWIWGNTTQILPKLFKLEK
jgi:hypothetical protein